MILLKISENDEFRSMALVYRLNDSRMVDSLSTREWKYTLVRARTHTPLIEDMVAGHSTGLLGGSENYQRVAEEHPSST